MRTDDHEKLETVATSREEPVILVTGATGNVGREVVSQLLETGMAVRALTRSPASANLPDQVDVVRGDLSEPEALEAHLDGVDAVFLVWPFLTAESAPAVVDALARHTRRVVYLSSASVRDDMELQNGPINQFHADVERLIEQTGLEWTFLRCTGFATNTLWWAPQTRADGVVRWPYGTAARSLLHETDIAAVAVRALTEGGHAGAKYVLSGPETLTQVEQVHAIGEAIGRPLRYEEIPPENARQQMLTQGWPPSVVDAILDAHAAMAAQPELVTSTVESVTGRPARTFREWAVDHADAFRRSSTEAASATDGLAAELVSLSRQGKFGEIMERLMSPDVVRVEAAEPGGPPVEMHGIEAVIANSRAWADENDVHGVEVDGPFLGGDRFAVRFAIDATSRRTRERRTITKVSLYTTKSGKVVREDVYHLQKSPA